jgi:hypothetical protein
LPQAEPRLEPSVLQPFRLGAFLARLGELIDSVCQGLLAGFDDSYTVAAAFDYLVRTGTRFRGGIAWHPSPVPAQSGRTNFVDNDRIVVGLGAGNEFTFFERTFQLDLGLQAHALLDKQTETFLVDVTPLSLRIGTVGGFTEKIIEKNTPIPIEKSKTFTTSRDGQDRVKIRVYQGESNRADDCELLGEFEFAGFRIGYRGDVKIDVTFEIDSNGIVNVEAADKETGQRTSTTISLSSGLSEGDIQRSMQANSNVRLANHRDLPAAVRQERKRDVE